MKEAILPLLGVVAALAGAVKTPEKELGPFGQWHLEIEEISNKTGVPVEYFCGLIDQESGWNPSAVSKTNCEGLPQFNQSAQRKLKLDDPLNGLKSIKALGEWTKRLSKEIGSKDPAYLALCHHDGGPTCKKGGSKDGLIHQARVVKKIKLYKESGLCGKGYVNKIHEVG